MLHVYSKTNDYRCGISEQKCPIIYLSILICEGVDFLKNPLFFILISAALILTGCSKEATQVAPKPIALRNTIQAVTATASTPTISLIYVTAGLYKDKNDTIIYPIIHGMNNTTAQEKVNDELKKTAISPSSTNNGQAPVGTPTGTYTGDYCVIYEKGDIMNILLRGYMNTGAAHGMPDRDSIFINTKTGTFYFISDLFTPGSSYLGTISNVVKSETPEKSLDMYTPNGGVLSTDGFYLTDQGVEIYFSPDELKFYSDEFPQFPVSFESLQADINEGGSFWKALQDPNGSISEPSYADVAKVKSLGFQPGQFGYAITKDAKNNTIVAILATDSKQGLQTFFFVNNRYLGTDTAKVYEWASLRPNGLGAIDITYEEAKGNGLTITYHWDGYKLKPNQGFPSKWTGWN
jgi:hypothetical protein